MFKITLISTDENPSSMGIKAISSNLIKHGFDTSVVIMSDCRENFNNFSWGDLLDLCRGSQLIGISSMTHGVKKAIQIKKVLAKNVKAQVIIGGIHATLNPESLFNDFDFICHGEGEDLIVELAECLANNLPFSGIPGLWLRYEGKIFKNKPQPLNKDINEYPFPDYDLKHHYIFESGRLMPMELVHINCDYFEVMGSRGCPHDCEYCSNHKIKESFPWRKKVRQYTIDYLIEHLKEISRIYPSIRSFWLEDDTFFVKDTNQIIEFADRYKKEINKPFNILVSPWTYSEEKVSILVKAGMDRLIFGIQSGSENTNKNIYNRVISNDKLFAIINSLNSFKGLFPYYDFIGMNPFESSEDLVNTIQFIKKIPVPFFMFSNNLAFYPGTKISERAVRAGIDTSKRDRHTDSKHGYSVLKKENLKHKLFHLILLMMGGKASRIRIGIIPRFIISDRGLKIFYLLDKRCGYVTDKFVALFAAVMIYIDFKFILKKRLNYKQIQSLKKMYHLIFK